MNKSGVNDLPAPVRKQIEVLYIYISISIYIRACLTQNNHMLVDHS